MHLDGNVLAGPAAALFDFDITMARGQCLGCGDVARIAQSMVYGMPMAYVARCRACGGVLAVLVDRGGTRVLNMSGLRWLRVDGEPSNREALAPAVGAG